MNLGEIRDRNGGSVPVERAFEVFGDIYEENQWGKLFTLTGDIDVQAHIRNVEVVGVRNF